MLILFLLHYLPIVIGSIVQHVNSSSRLISTIDDQLRIGNRPISIEPIVTDDHDQIEFMTIFERISTDSSYMIDINSTQQLFDAIDDKAANGFMVKSLCGYQINRHVNYIVLWERMSIVGQFIDVDMNADQFEIKLAQMNHQRMKPIYVCTYRSVSDQLVYAGVWHRLAIDERYVHWLMEFDSIDKCFDSDRRFSNENYYAYIFQPTLDSRRLNDTKTIHCLAHWRKGYGNDYRIETGSNITKMLENWTISSMNPTRAYAIHYNSTNYYYLIMWSDRSGSFSWINRSIPMHQLIGSVPTPSIDAQLMHLMRSNELPGLSLAIAYREQLIIAKTFGYANIRQRTQLTVSNRFRIASVSKSITTVAIFRLIETGRLTSLDQKVFGDTHTILGHRFGRLPYNRFITAITVRHLLEHTVGAWSNRLKLEFNRTDLADRNEFLSWLIDSHPPRFTVGSRYVYSNIGYMFLGRIIEKLSSIGSYEKYVYNEIFAKCGIPPLAGIGQSNHRLINEVNYYSDDNANPYLNWDPNRMDAAAGWTMTPIELLQFLVRIDGSSMKADILQSDSINEMIRPTALSFYSYAKGWQIGRIAIDWNNISTTNYYHFGSFAGSETVLSRRGQWSFAVCINKRGARENQHTTMLNEWISRYITTVDQPIELDLFSTDNGAIF